MKIKWKTAPNGVVHAELGNNLHIVITPVTVWVANKRPRSGGKEVRMWDPAVVAGHHAPTAAVIRRWSGGGNGNGQYPTLAAAKLGGIEDARCVGLACLRSLGVEI